MEPATLMCSSIQYQARFPSSFDGPVEKPGPHGLRGAMRAPQPMTDADIRPALRRRLLAPHTWDADTVLLEELGLCRGLVRVDLTPALHARLTR